MRVELVSVGDELLVTGKVNGNAAWLGLLFTDAGLTVSCVTTVPDDLQAIADAVRAAADRAGAVVVTGGLGPTSDDCTREALALAAGVPLVHDADAEQELAAYYARRGRTMHETSRRQADRPHGASGLHNPWGSAPGLRVELGGAVAYALPGVPREMRPMARELVLPELLERAGKPAPSTVRVIRCAVAGEPVVANALAPLEADLGEVRIAYLASPGDVRVRLTGPDPAAVDRAAERARSLLGPVAYGEGEDGLDVAVHRLLAARGATVAVAESLTGGLLAGALTDMAGASATFRGSVTAYTAHLKADLLGVDAALLAAAGPVHPEVAGQMAVGVRDRLGATYGVATTGVAGPEAHGGRPVGTVYVAVADDAGIAVVERRLPGERSFVRQLAVMHALDLLRRRLEGLPPYVDQKP